MGYHLEQLIVAVHGHAVPRTTTMITEKTSARLGTYYTAPKSAIHSLAKLLHTHATVARGFEHQAT